LNVLSNYHSAKSPDRHSDGADPVFVSLLFIRSFCWRWQCSSSRESLTGSTELLARRFHQQSPLGRILDPIADKMMLVTSFVVLSMRSVYPTPLPKHLPFRSG